MKKALYLFILSTLFLVSCGESIDSSSDNKTNPSCPNTILPDSSTNHNSDQNIQSYPDDYCIYPQTIILNEIRYDMIVDLTDSLNYELGQLIGHIIHENFLEEYIELYPNLIPVVDNYMHNSFTNDMIEIYSVREMDNSQYLALKIISEGNIVHTELFKSNLEWEE